MTRSLRKLYPAVSMFLLAGWSLIALVTEGSSSAAPLALSSSIAGLAALTYQVDLKSAPRGD